METKFSTMLQTDTPLSIKIKIEENMHRSKVVFNADDNKLYLEYDGKNEAENKSEEKLLTNPCLYRWLVPEDIAKKIFEKQSECEKLLEKTATTDIGGKKYHILYSGKSKNGKNRIVSQHLRGDVKKSTLRLTLYGLLLAADCTAKEADIDVLFKETYFEWYPLIAKDQENDYIVCLEAISVALGKYPLNIEGNPAFASKWTPILVELRKNCKK
jgi:hypothetical protein